ncbi:hypothetical protein ACFSC4_21120 [Deinococcus malanensis]|nr:hypothetical protein [Deinococcus malanensis]
MREHLGKQAVDLLGDSRVTFMHDRLHLDPYQAMWCVQPGQEG